MFKVTNFGGLAQDALREKLPYFIKTTVIDGAFYTLQNEPRIAKIIQARLPEAKVEEVKLDQSVVQACNKSSTERSLQLFKERNADKIGNPQFKTHVIIHSNRSDTESPEKIKNFVLKCLKLAKLDPSALIKIVTHRDLFGSIEHLQEDKLLKDSTGRVIENARIFKGRYYDVTVQMTITYEQLDEVIKQATAFDPKPVLSFINGEDLPDRRPRRNDKRREGR